MMPIQQPAVSIVMCTYNGSLFIDEQVQSILQQDYRNFELIIVDDKSTDDTFEKLKAWQATDSRIVLHQNEENVGYNKNFEQAIQLAKNGLIALSDQDDIWLPQKITTLVSLMNDPEVMLAHCRSLQLKNGRLNYKTTKLQYHFSGTDVRRFFFFNHVNGHGAIFRASLVKEVVPIPAGMMYDWWIAVNAIARGRIASSPQFLVHHRIHANNSFFSNTATSKKREPDLDELLKMIAGIPVLKPADRHYLETLITLLKDKINMPLNSFSKPLFRFLLRNRRIIFGHKRRLFPGFSYLKAALKYARYNYRGKGLSI